MNVREILLQIFSKMVEEILFGSKREVKIDGLSLPEACDLLFKYGFSEVLVHPVNMITGGLASKHNLLECCKKAKKIDEEIKKVLSAEIDYRSSMSDSELGINILDLLIKHNRSASGDEILSKDEIIQNCIVFYVAGVDTSKNTSEFSLQFFSRNQVEQGEFFDRIASKMQEKDLSVYESFESNIELQNYTKEILRLFSASSQLFPRLALRDFKIGKYKIVKGTYLNVLFNTFHHSNDYYSDYWKFDSQRFAKIAERQHKQKPAELMPFSLGKRNCIGRYLAELFVQSILIHFSKTFDMKALDKYEVNAVQGITYGLDSCFIRMRPKL